MSLEAAERAVREGDLDAALRYLQEQIRQRPADAKLRIFLFQLLCVLGQWERALTQLNVAADLDVQALGMAQMYRDAVQCEKLRAGVFAGERSPLIFGEPAEWLALLIESLLVTGTPRSGEAQSLRQRAFDAAPTSSGTLDGTRVRVDCRRGHAAGPSLRGRDQRALLLGAVRAPDESRSRSRRSIFATSSGSRRTSSSPTAGKRSV